MKSDLVSAQSQELKQQVSPQMVQAAQVLQMNAEEMKLYLEKLYLENPMAEMEEKEPESAGEERLRKLQWLDRMDEQNRAYYAYDSQKEGNGEDGALSRHKRGETLAETLTQQLMAGDYTAQERRIFSYIIHCLDQRGYCTESADQIASFLGISSGMAQHCLEIMKQLEPAGVCASSLQECLLLQMKDQEAYALERRIVQDYMDLLGKNAMGRIAQRCGVSVQKVSQAARVIRSLNPRPAQGFDDGEPSGYITPDITVVKFSDRFEIMINDYQYPSVKLNGDYVRMLEEEPEGEVRNYLLEKYRQVTAIQENIRRRNKTLLEFAACLVELQKDFFVFGSSRMKPLRLMDMAEKMNVHESTVSRAMRGKYLQCCWGCFPLHYFFTKSVAGTQGEEVSAAVVRMALKKLVDEEDSSHPYSDDALAKLLEKEGYSVSRRTVVKYREMLGIPNSRKRMSFV